MFISKIFTQVQPAFNRGRFEEINCNKGIDKKNKYEWAKIKAEYYPYKNETDEEIKTAMDNYRKKSYTWGDDPKYKEYLDGWHGKVTYDCKLGDRIPYNGKGVIDNEKY